MLGPARTSEHRLGALIRPPLQFGDGDEAELAPPNQPQFGLNVPLERVQRHAERQRRLLTTERNTRDISGRCTHGNLCLRYSDCYWDGSAERKKKSLTEEEREAADPWLTLAEIAAELRVNPATVRQWVSKGQLKASRAGVRKWIVRRSDLDRMLDETNLTADEVLEQLENESRTRSGDRSLFPPPWPRTCGRPSERTSLRRRRRRHESHGHLKHRGRWSCCSAR